MGGEVEVRERHLVDFMPAVLIVAGDRGLCSQQQLTAAGVAPHQHRVVQRSQALAVFVVWRGPQLQQSLQEEKGMERDRERQERRKEKIEEQMKR